MIHAVIDTNILVSAMLTHNPQAATARVLDYIVEAVDRAGNEPPLVDEGQKLVAALWESRVKPRLGILPDRHI